MTRTHLSIAMSLAMAWLISSFALADEPTVLFDGTSTDQFEFSEGAWEIAEDGSLTCRMDEIKQKNGKIKIKGKGYAWTKANYQNFELSLDYKLSAAANSGVFFRTDPTNPVQGGFEIQLIDDLGYQATHGKKNGKNLNGAFYDCQAASADPAKLAGQWNQFKLTIDGDKGAVEINGVTVNEFDISHWDTAKENPDGSPNKFKTALNDLPKTGRIGFQNHGQPVWFKNVRIVAFE